MPTASSTIAARIDRLPRSSYIRRLIILISLGGCFELYDLFFAAYVAAGLFKGGIFTPTTKMFFGFDGFASFIAAQFAGMFVGTILVSQLSDRFGRRSIFTYSLLWYSATTLIMAFQDTALGINFWRFVASIGIGVELVNIDAFVSELVPQDQRGRAFAFNQTIQFIAVPVVAFISYLLVPTTLFGWDGWRWVVALGAAGAVFIWFIRLGLPESPRWLAQRGRQAEAEAITQKMETEVRAETGRELPPPHSLSGEVEEQKGSWMEIWQGVYRGRTIMMVAYNLLQTIGFYGFSSWVPTLLIAKHIDVTKSLEYTFIMAIAAPFGPLLGYFVADKIERKWQVAGSALAIAIFGMLFAQQSVPMLIIVFGILITLANNWLSFSFHAYQAELYPTRIRAQAVGFVYSWSRFSVIFTSFIIAWILHEYDVIGVFTFIAAAMVGVFLIIGIFGPRTNGLRLEAIAH
jgi:MFS transporter, putative metabolite:H+ symporter